jgi:hypothetical protein
MTSAIPINVARQVLAELVRRGDVKPASREEMAGRVEDYRSWLEIYVTALLFEELDRLGKVSEFRVFPEGSDTKRDEFFRGLIPHYEEFLEIAMTLAVQALLGKSQASSSEARLTDA